MNCFHLPPTPPLIPRFPLLGEDGGNGGGLRLGYSWSFLKIVLYSEVVEILEDRYKVYLKANQCSLHRLFLEAVSCFAKRWCHLPFPDSPFPSHLVRQGERRWSSNWAHIFWYCPVDRSCGVDAAETEINGGALNWILLGSENQYPRKIVSPGWGRKGVNLRGPRNN